METEKNTHPQPPYQALAWSYRYYVRCSVSSFTSLFHHSSRSIVVVVFWLVRSSLLSYAVCFWVGRAPRRPPLASANGSERDLVGKSLLRLFVHPLDAFRVWIRVGSFFVKIDFDGFRAAVELFLHVGTVSVTCLKSKIWPKKNHEFFGQI